MTKRKPKPSVPVAPVQDLVVLAADKNTQEALDALLLRRPAALGIRPVAHSSLTHPEHDPGCLGQSIGLLRLYAKTHRHALVVFDREGSGRESASREELESEVEEQLRIAGWEARAVAIVSDPEVDNWAWSRSSHLPSLLGWNDSSKDMRDWLVERGFLDTAGQSKPRRPKEALEAVLAFVKKPRSSALYRAIAEKVSLAHCEDPAFGKLRDTLRAWFPSRP